MNKKLAGVAVVLAVAIAGGLSYQSAQAAKAEEKKRAASVHYLMEGLVAPNNGALKKALNADEPNWKKVSLYAAMLNEAGHCLMDDGRCPDGEWKKGAEILQQQTVEILAKAKEKDLEGAKKALAGLGKGCGTCHKAHKK